MRLIRTMFFEKKLKGGYIAQSKLLKIHFMVLSNRVGQDNFVGTGMTVKLGLVCLPDTEQKSKIRFSQIAYSGHVTCFDEKVFVQGSAKSLDYNVQSSNLDRLADIVVK